MGCASSGSFVPPENQVDDIWTIFKKDKLLGKGASGEVWSAKENKTGKSYAVKLLIKADQGNQAMFEQEATILKKLNHPNILGYFNCYEVRPESCLGIRHLGARRCAQTKRRFLTAHFTGVFVWVSNCSDC
jgi:serine/threonine protein kinase